jgi:Ni/Co efflux regulator RcnB
MENRPLRQREKETSMKKILLSAAALAAILAAPVVMADPDNNDQPKQHDTTKPDKGDKTDGPAMKGSMSGPAMKGPNDNATRGPANLQDHNPRGGNNNDNDRMRGNDNDRTINKTVNKTVVHKTVDRSVVLKVRANIRAPRRFHPVKAYVRPTGFYTHRWVYGERLPRAFFAPDYFILDFAAYGLLAPWDGYEWVRYGDDALLIDVDTGEVIRVEYDLFD